ncbi:hypothetical protein AAAA73_01260 [Bdellovibrio sp. GT3]
MDGKNIGEVTTVVDLAMINTVTALKHVLWNTQHVKRWELTILEIKSE